MKAEQTSAGTRFYFGTTKFARAFMEPAALSVELFS